MNALQELISAHCRDTGESIADVAARGNLSRQTVSAILHRNGPGGIPRRETLAKLAKGLNLSLGLVERAAAAAASSSTEGEVTDLQVQVLIDYASELDRKQLGVLLATARAMRAV